MMREPGIRKHHPADHRWPGVAHRASICFHSINCRKLSSRVIFPNDLAVFCPISAQPTVHAAGKYDARDCRDRRRMRWFARLTVSTKGVRSVPDFLPVAESDRGQPTAGIWSPGIEETVRHINVLAIHGNPPQDTASRTSLANLLLPNNFS